MAKKTQKEKALDIIIDAMAEIRYNLESSSLVEDLNANADAMLKLSEAYAKIEKADPSETREQIEQLVKLAGGYADGGII